MSSESRPREAWPKGREPAAPGGRQGVLRVGRGHTCPRGRRPPPQLAAPSQRLPRAAEAGTARGFQQAAPRHPRTLARPPTPPRLSRSPAGARDAARPASPRPHARPTHLIVAAAAGARGRGRGAGRGALAGQPAPGAAAPRLAGLRGAAGAHLLAAGVRAASCGEGRRRRRLTAGPLPLPSWRARARPPCARAAGGRQSRGGGERHRGSAGGRSARPPETRGSGPGGAGGSKATDGEAAGRARAKSAREPRLRTRPPPAEGRARAAAQARHKRRGAPQPAPPGGRSRELRGAGRSLGGGSRGPGPRRAGDQ